jgi:Na+/H+-dicarboxylate symporter
MTDDEHTETTPGGDGDAAPAPAPEATDPTPEAAASDPAPAEAPAKEGSETVFGIKVHNLIFVGMVLGLILGLVTYNLDHWDKLTLVNGTVIEGHVRVAGDEYVIQLPDHSVQRFPASEVLSDKLVKGEDTGAGKAYSEIIWFTNFFGKTIFMALLKMIIAPLILASIVAGIVSIKGLDQLKRIGLKTMLYYGCSTLVAVTIGLACVLTIRPGHSEASETIRAQRKADLDLRESEYLSITNLPARGSDAAPTPQFLEWLVAAEAARAGTGHEAKRFSKLTGAKGTQARDILKNSLVRPMLTNPFTSLSKGKSLGIIFAALLLGIAIVVVGKPAEPVANLFMGFNDVIMKITKWIMLLAPFCIMCIVAELVGTDGPAVFKTLAWYCATVIIGIMLHVSLLITAAKVVGRCSPMRLWRGLREALMIAFTTRSSAATLPVTMNCVTKNLGVAPRIGNFALPVGATMNMDGTALYEGIAVIFLLQIYTGMVDVPFAELTFAIIFVIFITAVMASVGAAAVPDAGLVTMVLVADAIGLPVYYIPLIFAVDAFLDMFRTTTNVLGDSVGCLVVQRLEGEPLPPEPAYA